MPVHTYTNWNKRKTDEEEKVEPFRKYCFICEGANTETCYFKKLIDLRKELNIHTLIDIRLWEKTAEDKDISFAKNLFDFALKQKSLPENDFDPENDKMIVVFDADILNARLMVITSLFLKLRNTTSQLFQIQVLNYSYYFTKKAVIANIYKVMRKNF